MVNHKAGAIIIILFLVFAIFMAQFYVSFDQEMDDAREKLLAGSRLINTSSGPIEYADKGEGYPVLVVHGAGGGYDQGLILSEVVLPEDFHIISPSRYGFLRTPVPDNATFADQADTFADLLDELNISKVAVVGISAGGPSTLEFALRYPDRVSAMVLVSAVVHEEKPMDLREKFIHYVIFKSDFLFWMIAEYFESSLVSFFGVTPQVQAGLTPDEEAWLSDLFIPAIHPISQRQAGMVNDRINFEYIDYQLDQITVPTLIVHARDDTLVNPSHSDYAALQIPAAEVLTLDTGGHILMGQQERVRSAIMEFLEQNIQPES